MDEQQIRNYFGNHVIYNFNASEEEFLSAFIEKNINYIITNYSIYFISGDNITADDRITVFADNTQGVI
jgi:hypothetical protein